ncbi:MAG TPA: hypothetical protein VGW40_09755 [Allosphingosinicella sp.]|nr:hypothetical protein [Allosphingosinicella sp.]
MRVRHAVQALWMSSIVWSAPAAAQPGRARGFDPPAIEVSRASRNAEPAPVGGYVRFYACELSGCGGSETAATGSGGDPWPIERGISRILTLRLDSLRPDFSATAILAASTAPGNRSAAGGWNSPVGARHYLTPYFRVDADTTVSVTVRLAAPGRRTVVMPVMLDVLRRGGMLLQPGPLVTPLNSEQLRRTSDFVDGSVSGLFVQNLTERREAAGGFPIDIRTGIGSWRVMAAAPRISMFSEVGFYSPAGQSADGRCAGIEPGSDLQACRAFAGLTPQRVLGLAVGENLTLGRALLADAAISAELTRLAAASGERDGLASARRLCGLVAAKAETLGFNRYDAAAAVWAFALEAQLEEGRQLLVLAERSCGATAILRRTKLI